MSIVGNVDSLWRYPVKSMRGEELDEAFASYSGIYGDRVLCLQEFCESQCDSSTRARGPDWQPRRMGTPNGSSCEAVNLVIGITQKFAIATIWEEAAQSRLRQVR